jgi:outer membrane lipoprotein carrier protein
MRYALPLIGLLAAGQAALGQSADDVLQRAVAARARVKTVRGVFEQTVTNPLVGSSAESRGEFQEQRPNRISIRFTQPAGDMIVGDGTAIWVYLPSATPGEVIKRPIDDRGAEPLDVATGFLDSASTRFDLSLGASKPVAGHSARALILKPKKSARAPFTQATVWVDDDDSQIREFETTESTGVTRHVRITTLTLNPSLDPGSFAFHVPRGVKVVDQLP